jgi:xylulokinase
LSAPLVIGIDLGTQSAKAGVFGTDGTTLAHSTAPMPLHRRGPDECYQEPEDFYRVATSTVASCMAQSGARSSDVVGIGIAGQMAGILGIAADGSAVTPYDSWLDSRCHRETADLGQILGSRLIELTGCPPMVAHAPKMLWWRRARPEVYAKVAKFVVPSAFVAGRLCTLPAADAYIDLTHLHFTGLVDAARAVWSDELIAATGLERARLPHIVAPVDPIGTLTAAAAQDCGLRAGTLVAAGLGDTAAGALGAGVVQPGQLFDTAGTASVLGVSTREFRPDPSGTLVAMRGAVPGQWISLSYLAGGDLLRWLPRVLGDAPLELLLKEAEAAPGADGLVFMPHLGGRILPASPLARGAWVGLEFSQTRGDLTRAVLESVAFEYAGFLERAQELMPELRPHEVRVMGGGSQNTFWSRLKASALGLPYVRLRRDSFSCWGAALTAAVAAGAVDDLAEAAAISDDEVERLQPDPTWQAVCAERLRDYRRVGELLAPTPERRR